MLCQAYALVLMERGAAGAIVNISSQAAERCGPDLAVYSISKAAVDQLTRCLAYELGPHKVRFQHVTGRPPTVTTTAVVFCEVRFSYSVVEKSLMTFS